MKDQAKMEVDDTVPEGEVGEELTETEAELYDRQIRLWGLESQKRLGKANIFISGLSGLGAEAAKNILLSGVRAVTLHDEKNVTEEDFCSQFLAPRASLGENRAKASIERGHALNPMVKLTPDSDPLASKDAEYFANFDVVILIGATNKEILRINEICRDKGVKFFAGDVWGMFGWSFADLQKHVFVEDVAKHKVVSKPNEKVKTELVLTTVQRELEFPSYLAVHNFDINSEQYLKKVKRSGPAFIVLRILQKFRDLHNRDPSYKSRAADLEELQRIRDEISTESIVPNDAFMHVFAQISPTAAIVGGVLAQEVIKTVSKKEAPHRNVFLFDPQTCCGFIETFAQE